MATQGAASDVPATAVPPSAAPAQRAADGLTHAEVKALQALHGRNVVAPGNRHLWWSTVRDALTEPMFLLLLSASGLYGLIGEMAEAMTLLALVIAVLTLTIVQSHRTASVLEGLRDLSAPRAQVLRDGKREYVSATELVPGDVVFIEEGAKVPADGAVMEAHELSVDESLLTGESIAVVKFASSSGESPLDVTQSRLYSGSMVVRGQGRMCVTATGAQTDLGRLGMRLAEVSEPASPLQVEIRRFVTRFATLAVIICVLLVFAYRWRTGTWIPGLLAGITLAMGILPEELPMIFTVFMALGARRIAREGVLTRRLSAIQTLGQTSVLCVDKTGTLTQNRMSVRALYARGEEQWLKDGAVKIGPAFHELLEYLVLASEIEPLDPMERAFHETGRSCLAGTGRLHEQWSLVQEYALTPELPAMSHGWETPELDHRPVACKGAPEAICSLCHLGPDDARALMERATRMAESGLRVLGVARARHHGEDWPEQQHDFEFSLVGLVGLLDPVRPEVAGAVTELKAAGVRAVMITGDYPSTAQAVATEVGIDSARIMTGADLAAMDDTALQRAIAGASVFARVRPEQKLRLVDAFKQAGEIVAMTGDGVNDAPALKAAHIGIAMGTRGAEVAREVASLVLLRDDLTPIVSTLRLGRRIYDNLKLAVAYTIAVHIPMIAAATVPVLAGWPLILAPVHIVFLELIITPVCSIVFENERGSRSLMLEPPRRIGERLMSNRTLALSIALGCAAALIVVGMYALLVGRGLDPIDARTAAFVLLVAGNIGLMFAVRALPQRPARRRHHATNPYGWVVVLVTTLSLGLLMTWPALARLFGMRALLAVWT